MKLQMQQLMMQVLTLHYHNNISYMHYAKLFFSFFYAHRVYTLSVQLGIMMKMLVKRHQQVQIGTKYEYFTI